MESTNPPSSSSRAATHGQFGLNVPAISLPKGGGAISGIGEKFAANPATGTSSFAIPVFTSPSRSGFNPKLSLSYDSGSGNGPFGMGWSLPLPSISRRTDKGLPKYNDADESDVFILSDAEDLVPVLIDGPEGLKPQPFDSPPDEPGFLVQRYRPRIERAFSLIERWTSIETGIIHWRTISRENITTRYGASENTRIADPADPSRIFNWLICDTRDDKGNAILYSYKREDDANIDKDAPYENNRRIAAGFAQRYLKSISYGNRTPVAAGEDLASRADWLFQLVLDYGEHDGTAPTTREVRSWPVRPDTFSRYRSTFEIRTYRLCRRILMFHHFPEELGGVLDYLVRSTDLSYKESPVASFIEAVTQTGYKRQADGSYLKKSLPRLALKYSDVKLDETVREIVADSLANLPQGVDGTTYRWVDLDSEGLSGVLTEQASAWLYKRNLGNGTFGPAEWVAERPSLLPLGPGRQQFADLAGEGRVQLVQFSGSMAGFYERGRDGNWLAFTPFKSAANFDIEDDNVRFLDLTGDGQPDLLISEDAVFTWHESLGKEGFAESRRSAQSDDETKGPNLVFADLTQSIFLADMVGDGLSDIVRIRNGDICYWPNLGYGRFGAKVSMGNAPLFDAPELFDPRRIHLADIDGSGNADLIYVGAAGAALYFNQSGNVWSKGHLFAHFPQVDSVTSVAAIDLLGNGTACLVWSSPLAADGRSPMRYIDLMGGQKPHLLVQISNNMGAETELEYAASTSFFLQDRREGRPWLTKLPFPVHVIRRIEHRDLVSNTRLVSTYRYRHGHYDGLEREFHGFAYVEQRDAETVIDAFDLPPIVTKTWFHNGAFLEDRNLEGRFKEPDAHEYFTADREAVFLPDTQLPPGLTSPEEREAVRALRGSILRQEFFADDGSPKAAVPYSVSERSHKLSCLQRRGPNRHAAFFVHPSETLDYHYEREPTDPRIAHELTLTVDDYGNVLKSVGIAYTRRTPAFDEQGAPHATLTEYRYTNPVLEANAYRTPLPAEVKTFELTALGLAGAVPLKFEAVRGIAEAADEIAYEAAPTGGRTQKRLIEETRTLYRANDLSALLAPGVLQSMALPGESYQLSLTPGLLDLFQANASPAELTAILIGPEGGYRDLDEDGRLWVPSGRVFYSPDPGVSPSQELAFAQSHFFEPHRYRDPFGSDAIVAYDAKYTLLIASTRDRVGNETSAQHDYRVLQPESITDPNGNRTLARFDALGMLAGTAACGKVTGPTEGDSFDNFGADLSPEQIRDFFAASDPRALAGAFIGTASTRIVYDLEHVPVCAAAIARETHVSDLPAGGQSKLQLRFVYSDGFGREAQTKAQAAAGPLDPGDPASPLMDPRWIATGAKIYNNKGQPVRQYEPFFSTSPRFEIEQRGVSSTLFYDAPGRLVARLHPARTYEKIVFDAWRQATWDANDTIALNPRDDPDVGNFFRRIDDADYLPTWRDQRIDGALGPSEKLAAEKATRHAGTPATAHLDAMARAFLAIVDNGGADQQFATQTVLDVEGNERAIIDALGRTVMRYDYDLLGQRFHQTSMEAGERWVLNDAAGKPFRSWNGRKYAISTEYDALRRPVRSLVQGGDPSEPNSAHFPQPIVFERLIYGDSPESGLTEAQQRQANLRTKVFKRFDGAGVLTTDLYDFKGNPLHSARQFASDYKTAPDWSRAPPLESDSFASATAYDALNRAIATTTPDNTIYRPTFDEAGLLRKVDVNLRGATAADGPVWTAIATKIDHNARGQRTLIEYGNGARTAYAYDAQTFRLIALKTTRPAQPNGLAVQILADQAILQDITYIYDPVGNITRIQDAALKTVFNANERVDPVCDYTYDALYRLIEATGREHISQSGFQFAPPDGNYRDYPFAGVQQSADLNALQSYTEKYDYDPVGNFRTLKHQTSRRNWTRSYIYDETSLIEPAKRSNRLSQAALETSSPPPADVYAYDAHGNITRMPHLPLMQWTFQDHLSATSRQVVNSGARETTFYVYDWEGTRTRKVTEAQNGTLKTECLYLGSFEIDRHAGGTRESLHVMDDRHRIALIETVLPDSASTAQAFMRYQIGNHLGSSSLELDAAAQLVSYEEYAPYGGPVFQAVGSLNPVLKRYRYSGKERDQESGFYYHGARYYTPWTGRWTSCDPSGLVDGVNLYRAMGCNPVTIADPTGRYGIRDLTGDLERVNRYLTIVSGPGAIVANKVSKDVAAVVAGKVDPAEAVDSALESAVPVAGTLISLRQGIQETKAAYAKAETARAGGDYSTAARGYVDAALSGLETATVTAGDVATFTLAPHSPNLHGSAGIDPKLVNVVEHAGGTPHSSGPGKGATHSPTSRPHEGTSPAPATAPTGQAVIGPDPNQRPIPAKELVTIRVKLPPKSRGVTPARRRMLREAAERQGDVGSNDAAHIQAFVLTEPGQDVLLRPQDFSINRGEGTPNAKAAAARRQWNAQNPNGPHLPVREKKKK